ncbi:MAG: ribonuclease H-like domain-containing protein [Bradymonadaceae bacterium]
MTGDIKKRLERLHGSQRRAERASDDRKSGTYRADDVDERPADDHPDDGDAGDTHRPGGDSSPFPTVENRRGVAFRIERTETAPFEHGDTRLDPEKIRQAGEQPGERKVAPSDVGYLDTETTGLDDTARAFCVGLGHWRDRTFQVRQFVMHAPTDEPAVLRETVDALAELDLLYTYNGESFDLPLLRRRCRDCDIEFPTDFIHRDLLDAARTCFDDLPNHRLTTVERCRVGFERVDDIPGAEIPDQWEAFKTSRDPDDLRDILRHNRLDIRSLPAIAVSTAAHDPAREPTNPPAPGHTPDRDAESGSKTTREKPDEDIVRRLDRARRAKRQSGSTSRTAASEGGTRTRSEGAEDGGCHPEPTTSARDTLPPAGEVDDIDRYVERLREYAQKLSQQGDIARAVPALERIVALAPRHSYALRALAKWHRRQGDRELAEHYRARLDRLSPY